MKSLGINLKDEYESNLRNLVQYCLRAYDDLNDDCSLFTLRELEDAIKKDKRCLKLVDPLIRKGTIDFNEHGIRLSPVARECIMEEIVKKKCKPLYELFQIGLDVGDAIVNGSWEWSIEIKEECRKTPNLDEAILDLMEINKNVGVRSTEVGQGSALYISTVYGSVPGSEKNGVVLPEVEEGGQ